MNQAFNATDILIVDPYMRLYEIAKEKKIFENEQALQSAVASMYIRYNQLADKNPHFNNLIKQIVEESKVRMADTNGLNEVIAHIYAPLMEKSLKARSYIEDRLKTPIHDFAEFENGLIDYMARNHVRFDLKFDLSIIEEE